MKSTKISTLRERKAAGQALRKITSRASHGKFKRAHKTPDVISIVKAANMGRVPTLVPEKMSRMSVSPFTFFRGAAPIMAADLATLPVSGLNVQLCGDAHVRNLGAYAAPDGHLVFDLNDFDETIIGPWEWDIKRLAASIVVAGRDTLNKDDACIEAVEAMVCSYRKSMWLFAQMPTLELARHEIGRLVTQGIVQRILSVAERVTPAKTITKLTETPPGGLPRFHDKLPVLEHVPHATEKAVLASLADYRNTLGANRQMIFDAFKPVDVAFKIVGTGSVGTRDYVVLFFGNGLKDPLFLQVKESLESCYTPYLPKANPPSHHGQRVAQGQQRMQTESDPFLGWTSIEGRDFLVRQLSDHKASLDPEHLKGGALFHYAVVCGEALAKAHARTGDAAAIAGYCGESDKLDHALAKFAVLYADQTKKDWLAFKKAIANGKIKANKPKAK